ISPSQLWRLASRWVTSPFPPVPCAWNRGDCHIPRHNSLRAMPRSCIPWTRVRTRTPPLMGASQRGSFSGGCVRANEQSNAALDPIQRAILNTPVIEDAADNRLRPDRVQNFLVAFYPVVRDFPQWLQQLLDRCSGVGRDFFEDNIRVERRHAAMWRAMGDGFG